MRVLVTRPEADAKRTAAALRDRGHEPIVAPLLRLEIIADAEFGNGPWSAVLLTSANAVRGIAGHARREELSGCAVFTVGGRSAQSMREAGFANVASANGDVRDLVNLISSRLPKGARLLYLAGEERSGDLAGELRTQGFAVETVLIYRVVTAESLPPAAAAALANGIEAVLHFSRRSAETYIGAARKAGLAEAAFVAPLQFCLSERVAAVLRDAGAGKVRVAARPDEAALLDLCG